MGNAAVLAAVVLVYICAGVATVDSATLYDINPWIIPPGAVRYPPINATCGDAIQFVWSQADGSNGVFKLPANSNGVCPTVYDSSTGVQLATVTAGGSVTYNISDEPSFWVTSPAGQGSNCELGQIIQVTVTCPASNTSNTTAAPNAAAGANLGQPADGAGAVEPLPPIAAPAGAPAAATGEAPLGTEATPGAYGAYGASAATLGAYGTAAVGGYGGLGQP